MPDLFIRDIPQAVLERLDGQAAAAGQSRAAWLRQRLEELAEALVTPVVRERYRLVCAGPGEARAYLRRYRDGEPPSVTWRSFSGGQVAAVEQARLLMAHNGPGDRERAIAVLQGVFKEVLEGAG